MVGGLLSSAHPFPHCSYSLLVRSLRDGSMGGCGYGAPFHVARRSFLSYSCPVVLPYLVGSSLARCVPILLIHEARKRTNGDGGGDAGGLERDAPRDETTRSPTRRGRRMAETTREGKQASRQGTRRTDETDMTRRKNETPSDENERTTTTKGNWDRAAL